ncbi:HEPN domain-containing protein [Methanospirillum purgamenti]|jgi:HEPN domain-containing protein|uniref:HEPN domain-containing protein n=1 Tax=Methanospirillum hungatei TaxID=2203 RepID=A0A8F5VNA0_METHU|nr:HEPN domain-containing protein [Methanospirillum hungatei]QXO94627.1 HEPN domain-containing protein [Methanospirillum hungatei]
MKNRPIVEDWLIRSRSNLCRAQSGQTSDEILFEDLCFDCQQSVEKSLKGLLIAIDIEAPRTHNISILIEYLAKTGITIPHQVIIASDLTEFAVQTRYPGIYEPITGEEFAESLEIAENVYSWVLSELAKLPD